MLEKRKKSVGFESGREMVLPITRWERFVGEVVWQTGSRVVLDMLIIKRL